MQTAHVARRFLFRANIIAELVPYLHANISIIEVFHLKLHGDWLSTIPCMHASRGEAHGATALAKTFRLEREQKAKRDPEHTRSTTGAEIYNRRDYQMVTHSSTSRPVQCSCTALRVLAL